MIGIITKLLALFFLFSSIAIAQPVRIVTEKLPPLQFSQADGAITGAMVDIVNLLLQKTNIDANIEILPWARSYQIALEQENTLIFSMLRGEDREDKFIWIGKLFAINSYLVSLKGNQDFQIDKIDDAKQYSVGSIRQDLAETYLRKHGFTEGKNLYLSSNYKVLWQMLFSGRTELAFTNNILWKYEIEDTQLDPSQIAINYQIPDIASDLYLAASLGTDEKIINQLRKALAEIKSDGHYQQILQKWHLKTTAQ
ncbi:MAG: transporter substrate-binding domain-containing protein [Colwellia sp.]|nr:transporter substrate-binding domain-containing protein [Colwellia sp.]MCW8863256.1 transporter substrate-binding domain-containing protein [Colwellia sp.]MCW9083213.1 transporter substrate-binding domain-containing protein [Colwellia sp.]